MVTIRSAGLIFAVLLISPLTSVGQMPVCPITVNRGSVWIDDYSVIVQNIGTGKAMAIAVIYTRVVFGPQGVTNVSEQIGTIAELGPGEKWERKFNKKYSGTWSASVGACVSP